MKIWVPLSIFLVLIIAISGVFFVSKKNLINQPQSPASTTVTTGTKKETVQITLALIPEQTAIKIGEETNYTVKIKNNTLGVSIVECNFIYDPESLEIVNIEPGNFLTNSNVLNTSIDPVQGKISYTLASLKYSSGEGDLFKILVKGKSPSQTLNNILVFDRNNVKVGLRDLNKKYSFGEDEVVVIFEELPITVLP